MKLSRAGRPSPAMVLAALALVFAMVGTAVAGPDAISSAVTKKKVKKIAKKQANKQITKRAPGLSVAHANTASSAPAPPLFAAQSDASQIITANTTLATLNLPAGSYLVQAKLNATHNGTTASTRIECAVASGGQVVDTTKIRLQANTGAEPVIFAGPVMLGTLSLPAPGAVSLICTSTNGSPIDTTSRRLSALPVGSIQG